MVPEKDKFLTEGWQLIRSMWQKFLKVLWVWGKVNADIHTTLQKTGLQQQQQQGGFCIVCYYLLQEKEGLSFKSIEDGRCRVTQLAFLRATHPCSVLCKVAGETTLSVKYIWKKILVSATAAMVYMSLVTSCCHLLLLHKTAISLDAGRSLVR